MPVPSASVAPAALLDRLAALGEKKAGTAAGQQARALIRERLAQGPAGLEIREERFPVRISAGSRAVLARGDRGFEATLYDNTGLTGELTAGDLLVAGRRLSPRRASLARGRIVVFCNNLLIQHRLQQVPVAYQAGAAGVVIGSDCPVHLRRGLGFPPILGECPIPAISVSRADYRALRCAPVDGWTIRYHAEVKDAEAVNLVADLPGAGGRRGRIVLGAHYDTWCDGAQDNGVAVVLLLDLLATFAREPLGHDLRAIFFDAEEIGILGSAHHVQSNDLGDYRAYLNLEMPVPARGGRLKGFLYTHHAILKRTFSRLGLLGRGILPLPLGLFYRIAPIFPADVDAFYRSGIPCATTFCSNPNLHTPGDTVANIRMDQYAAVRDFLAGMIRRIDDGLSAQEGV
jgi:hypothetical protein